MTTYFYNYTADLPDHVMDQLIDSGCGWNPANELHTPGFDSPLRGTVIVPVTVVDTDAFKAAFKAAQEWLAQNDKTNHKSFNFLVRNFKL